MVAALSFLLGYENIEEEDESGASSSEDESIEKPIVLLSKEDVYKVSPPSPSSPSFSSLSLSSDLKITVISISWILF